MDERVFEDLAEALDRLPNGFPRTPSNVEIPMLKKIFSVREAELALHLTGSMEAVDSIAEGAGLTIKETRSRLMAMVRRGLVWFDATGAPPRFRLAPFVVGIYEGQVKDLDHEFSHLFEQYLLDGGGAGIMRLQPALHRVLPARQLEKSEWILPYEDVRAILEGGETFRENDCICRKQQELIGKGCDFPRGMCLSFTSSKRPPQPGDLTREEALAILDRAEEAGLVHAVSNVREGVGYICNCCGCCCAVLRGINEWGLENSVAHANYFAVVEGEECAACGMCMERCQVGAVTERYGSAHVDRERCIGCGLCASACPGGLVRIERKAESEIVHPPRDFAAWERERQEQKRMKDEG